MGRRSAILDPTNVQDRLIEVGLLPTKIDKLGRAEPVPESDQNHHRVTVALPIVLGRLDEPLDLRWRQMLAGPQRAVRCAPGQDAFSIVRFSGSELTSFRLGAMRKSFGSN